MKSAFCPSKADPSRLFSSRKFVLAINQRVETAESSPPSIILPPRCPASLFFSPPPSLPPFSPRSLSLSQWPSFFFGTTWLSRRRCIDSSASIRSTIYAATVLPASLVFLSSFFPFFSRWFGTENATASINRRRRNSVGGEIRRVLQ